MKTIIFSLICLYHIALVAYGSPVKKSGVNYEKLVKELQAESFEVNGSDESPVIFVNLESLESGSQEIPLDFLAESSSNESSESEESEEYESEDASVELKNSGECPQTTVFPEPESDSDENPTCPMTFPTSTSEDPETDKEGVDIDEEKEIEIIKKIFEIERELKADEEETESISDENGTCPMTSTTEDLKVDQEAAVVDTDIKQEEESDEEIETDEETMQESPKITITKFDESYLDDSSSSSSSSEEVDMIIMPFLEVDDLVVLKELDVPFLDDMSIEREQSDSNEITFNLIDSNDLKKHEEDSIRPDKDLEGSFVQKQFSRFLDSIMGIFDF